MSHEQATTEEVQQRLLQALEALRILAGEPSHREIARRIAKRNSLQDGTANHERPIRTISHHTVSRTFKPRTGLPAWANMEAVVQELGGSTAWFRDLWQTAEQGGRQSERQYRFGGSAWQAALVPYGGTLIAALAGGGRDAYVWDALTGMPWATFRDHVSDVWSVALSPVGGSLVAITGTGPDDAAVRAWDVPTRSRLSTLRTTDDWASSCAPAAEPNYRTAGGIAGLACSNVNSLPVIATANVDGSIRMIDINNPRSPEPGLVISGHRDPVWSVAVGETGGRVLLVSASAKGEVSVWDHRGVRIRTIPGAGRIVTCGTGKAAGLMVTGYSHDGVVRVWRLDDGEMLQAQSVGPRGRGLVAFLEEQVVLITSDESGRVCAWDRNGAPVQELALHSSEVTAMACANLSQDVWVLTASSGTAKVSKLAGKSHS